MGAIGTRRQASMTSHIEARGSDTYVGPVANARTIKTLWEDAELSRVQAYLNENEWGKDVYELRMPYYVLDSPYSLKNGMEVTDSVLSVRCVVRKILPERQDNTVLQVSVLVVSTTE